LEAVGLDAGHPVEVDDRMRVPGIDWLYAIGDLNGRVLLTHMGKYQARVAVDVILGEDAGARVEAAAAPRVVFTDPQVAAVGLTYEAALERGLAARAVDVETSDTAGASFYGHETPGTSRMVLDTTRDVILGAAFVGFEVAEMLHAASIAIAGELTVGTLAHAVPAFPTRSEIWLKLLEAYGEHYGG
jgi:dihydrolipoamide dehydrogenase